MSTPPPVRRCKGCGEPAVLSGLVTNHRGREFDVLGSRSHRCQSCGRRFTLYSWQLLLTFTFVGVILTPLLIGLPVLGLTWRLYKQDAWNPVVPGAEPPTLRFRMGPPPRTCGGCGGDCAVSGVVQRYVRYLPAGEQVHYICEGCGAKFVIESLYGLALTGAGGLLLAAFGAGLILGGAVLVLPLVGGALSLLAASFTFYLVSSGLRLRWRNPVRPDGLTP